MFPHPQYRVLTTQVAVRVRSPVTRLGAEAGGEALPVLVQAVPQLLDGRLGQPPAPRREDRVRLVRADLLACFPQALCHPLTPGATLPNTCSM